MQRRRRAASGAELEQRGWAKRREREWREEENLFIFKTTQTNEFKQRFEFKHSKQCTSMYAIVNSYISLINQEK
jgi:hypothetical protein